MKKICITCGRELNKNGYPRKLKRLTDMTHEEFKLFFGDQNFTPQYIGEHIRSMRSLAGFHILIAKIGYFDTYRKIKEASYDVEFILG